MKRWLLCFYVWALLVLYAPRIYGIDFGLASSVIGICIAFVFHNKVLLKLLTEDSYSALVSLAFLYIFLIGLAWTIGDPLSPIGLESRLYYAARLLRSLAVWLVIAIVCIKYSGKLAAQAMFHVGAIHVLSVYISIYDIFGLRDLIVAANTYNAWDEEGWEVLAGVRAKGLMTGYDQAGLFILGWGIVGYNVYRRLLSKIAIIGISLGGMMFTSRTALYSAILLFFIALIHRSIRSSPFAFFGSCAFLILFFSGIYVYLHDLALIFSNNPVLAKAFELFINFAIHGNLSTASSDDLFSNHYLYQADDLTVIIFGSPERSSSGGHLDSDVAYIQILYNFGAFFALLIISYHLFLMLKSALEIFKSTRAYLLMMTLATMALLIVSFKGPYLFGRGLYDYWLLSLALFRYSPYIYSKEFLHPSDKQLSG